MELEQAIRGRRTHKAFAPEPIDPQTLEQLFDLARWAPNHHLTSPWRFRVLGPQALARLKQATGPDTAAKLDRAPTLIAVSTRHSGEPVQDAEGSAAVEETVADAPADGAAPDAEAPAVEPVAEAAADGEPADGAAGAEYIVLLAAHDRGLAGYWRTPAALREPAGRDALKIPRDEELIGLLHLGHPRQQPRVPERAAVTDVAVYLD